MMDPTGLHNRLLVLDDTKSEKTKWAVAALNELLRMLQLQIVNNALNYIIPNSIS